jgi:hypothetical protein
MTDATVQDVVYALVVRLYHQATGSWFPPPTSGSPPARITWEMKFVQLLSEKLR